MSVRDSVQIKIAKARPQDRRPQEVQGAALRRSVSLQGLHLVLLALLAALLTACAALETQSGAGKHAATSVLLENNPRVIVLPMFTLIKEFRQYDDLVHAELVKRLDALGYDTFLLSDKQYKDIRRQALIESGAMYNPRIGLYLPSDMPVYIQSILRQLAQLGDYHLVIFPELQLRKAVLAGDKVGWDGIVRPFLKEGRVTSLYKVPNAAKGLSIKVSAYTASGGLQMEGFGGLVVPYILNLNDTPPSYYLRRDMFAGAKLDSGFDFLLAPLRLQQHQPD